MRLKLAPLTKHRTAILSIHPCHAGRIYSGAKTWEFRRVLPGFDVGDLVLIYETSPVSLVTGEFHVGATTRDQPAQLAALESNAEERATLIAYLKGAERCGALRIVNPVRWPEPRTLTRLGISSPPQSYRYVNIPVDR